MSENFKYDYINLTDDLYGLSEQGAVVAISVLTIYSENLSSYLTEAYSFFCKKLCLKRTKEIKRGRGWPSFFKRKDKLKIYIFSEKTFPIFFKKCKGSIFLRKARRKESWETIFFTEKIDKISPNSLLGVNNEQIFPVRDRDTFPSLQDVCCR